MTGVTVAAARNECINKKPYKVAVSSDRDCTSTTYHKVLKMST